MNIANAIVFGICFGVSYGISNKLVKKYLLNKNKKSDK